MQLSFLFRAFSLAPQQWQALLRANPSVGDALIILGIVALANTFPQIVILLVNRVRPRRLVLSILLKAIFLLMGNLFVLLNIHIIAVWVFGIEQSLRTGLIIICLANAVRILELFTLIPYLGGAIAITISIYFLLVIDVAVSVAYDLSQLEALLAILIGWVLSQVLEHTVGRPLMWLQARLLNRSAGVKLKNKKELERLFNSQFGEEG